MEETMETKTQAVEERAKKEAEREIIRKATRIRKRRDGKVRTAFYVDADDLEFMRNNLELADARSMNEFACKAIRFYVGFLKTQDTEFYQMHSLASLLKAKLDASERRITDALLQLAVQLGVLELILEPGLQRLSDEEFDRLARRAAGMVANNLNLFEKE